MLGMCVRIYARACTHTHTHTHTIKMTDARWLLQNYILKNYGTMNQTYRLNFPETDMCLIINGKGYK